MAVSTIIEHLSTNLVDDHHIEAPLVILSSIHEFNYRVLYPTKEVTQMDFIYFWDNLFQIIIENRLKQLSNLNLRETFHEAFKTSLTKCPRLLLTNRIVNHILSFKLDINFQKYLGHYFEEYDFSDSNELIVKDIDVVSDLYLKGIIDESIYSIIFRRFPTLKSYSSVIGKKLEDCFYLCKTTRILKKKSPLLKEFLGQKNMSIRNFYFRGALYPSLCDPHTGKFKKFLDGTSDKSNLMFNGRNLVPKNFSRVVKNEFSFFFNLKNKNELSISNSSIWRDQMRFIADYFYFVYQHDSQENIVLEEVFSLEEKNTNKENVSLTPKSKKRKRSKSNSQKILDFHPNSKFKPKTGKRVRHSNF